MSVRAPVGELNFGDSRYGIGRGLAAIVPMKCDSQFLGYALLHSRGDLGYVSTGSTYDAVSASQIGNLTIPLPDLETQKAIADFLYRETACIDQLIERKQRQVKLVEEALVAECQQVLTLGAGKSEPLVSDPGLEWVRSRPTNWRVLRLKYFFREITDYTENGVETLFSLRMREGLVPHNDVSDKELLPSDLVGYKRVMPGQIVMNRMRAAIGLFGLADAPGIVSPDYSIFDVLPGAHAGYFLRLFKTIPLTTAFRLLSKGLGNGHSGFMRLNADRFGEVRVAVPPYEEQIAISAVIEARTSQTKNLKTKVVDSIDRLHEFRAALITAAVTGQIDVTSWGKQEQTDRGLDQIQEALA